MQIDSDLHLLAAMLQSSLRPRKESGTMITLSIIALIGAIVIKEAINQAFAEEVSSTRPGF